MSIPVYADTIPNPPAVTSGSTIQTYQDPNGDLWVAKNGVRGGQWRRAYDVLRARLFRNTGLALTAATWTALPFDGTTYDEYGLMTLNNGNVFTVPTGLAGFWRMSGTFSLTAVVSRVLSEIYYSNATELQRGTDVNGSAVSSVVTAVLPLNVGDVIQYRGYSSVAATFNGASQVSYFTIEYHGPPTGT